MAASIVAKVTRDKYMMILDNKYRGILTRLCHQETLELIRCTEQANIIVLGTDLLSRVQTYFDSY